VVVSGALLVVPGDARADLRQDIPLKRGDFAFRYSYEYTPQEMAWLSRFDMVVTGRVMGPEQVLELRAAGCRLLYYEWLPAFYAPAPREPEREFARALLAEHPDWLLNPQEGLYGHSGAAATPAHYYDMAAPGLSERRVKHLIAKARDNLYDGVFFDTTTLASVHPTGQQTFKQRHPDASYDSLVAEMLDALGKADPELILFSNQGYRQHAHYLPHVGFDLTESYMTSNAWAPEAEVYIEGEGLAKVKETHVNRWYNPDDLWKSVAHYCRELITEPIREHGYSPRICHLNYGHPRYVPTGATATVDGREHQVFKASLDREAIYYGLACALLLGHTGYYEASPGVPADDVHFVDMGDPLGESYTFDEERGLAWRLYENGIVAVNDSGAEATLAFEENPLPPGMTGLVDLFTGQEIPDFAEEPMVRLPVSRYVATARTVAAGRIFVYVK